MDIDQDKVVGLTYELRADNEGGQLIQKVDENSPFYFLFGHNNVIKGFESNLKGKSTGDDFGFSIPSDEAYGPVRKEAIVELDKKVFNFPDKGKEDEMLQVGNSLALQDQNGNPLDGVVLSVDEEKVKMDFNHPLAGVNLYFTGEILEVREATDSEVDHGHVHADGAHS